MERLTGKDEYGYYAPRDVTLNCLKKRGELVDRLAAYEDTGLEPEEIAELIDCGEITQQQEYFISEKADSIIAGLKELIAKVDERNHVTELLQAEASLKQEEE